MTSLVYKKVNRQGTEWCGCGNVPVECEKEGVWEQDPRKTFEDTPSTFLRERSFLIIGTGAEDFRQGYGTFFHYFLGIRKF